jgi:hypothetical protein
MRGSEHFITSAFCWGKCWGTKSELMRYGFTINGLDRLHGGIRIRLMLLRLLTTAPALQPNSPSVDGAFL